MNPKAGKTKLQRHAEEAEKMAAQARPHPISHPAPGTETAAQCPSETR